jgi:tryptophan synthase alpha chain
MVSSASVTGSMKTGFGSAQEEYSKRIADMNHKSLKWWFGNPNNKSFNQSHTFCQRQL